ncbi:hypothetical protein D3C75_1086940 [compost metagenome]
MFTRFSIINGHCKYQLFDVSGHFGQINFDLLVIAITLTSAVITLVFNRAVRAGFVVEENEMSVRQNLAVITHCEYRRVEVKSLTVSYTRIPAQTDHSNVHGWCFFGQGNVTAFYERNCHF